MKISFSIPQSVDVLSKDILKAFLPDVRFEFDKAINRIKGTLPNLVYDIVRNSPEYDSIVSGQLKYELGIPDGIDKITALIGVWSKNIFYKYSPPKISGYRITASFRADLFKANFSDVLGMNEAQVYDTLRGYSLPWLQWLVLDGSVPLIPHHHVELVNSDRSRTGGALMRFGGNWGVPSSFTGTIADNWITRAIDARSSSIEQLVERAFNNVMR